MAGEAFPGFDLVVFSGVQFSFLPYGDDFVVNDGHHNRVLHVTLDRSHHAGPSRREGVGS